MVHTLCNQFCRESCCLWWSTRSLFQLTLPHNTNTWDNHYANNDLTREEEISQLFYHHNRRTVLSRDCCYCYYCWWEEDADAGGEDTETRGDGGDDDDAGDDDDRLWAAVLRPRVEQPPAVGGSRGWAVEESSAPGTPPGGSEGSSWPGPAWGLTDCPLTNYHQRWHQTETNIINITLITYSHICTYI